MGLRCPNCTHAGHFTIGCKIEVEFDEEGKRSGQFDDRYLEYGADTYCICVTCGHRGHVHEFRDFAESYVPDAKVAMKNAWDCIDMLARVNDAIASKDKALSVTMRNARWKLCDMLNIVERHIKRSMSNEHNDRTA